MENSQLYRLVLSSTLIGTVIALLQVAASDVRITPGKALFRALSNGFLSLSSCAVLLFVPDVSEMDTETLLLGVVGLSSLVGSLGTSGLEAILKRKLGD